MRACHAPGLTREVADLRAVLHVWGAIATSCAEFDAGPSWCKSFLWNDLSPLSASLISREPVRGEENARKTARKTGQGEENGTGPFLLLNWTRPVFPPFFLAASGGSLGGGLGQAFGQGIGLGVPARRDRYCQLDDSPVLEMDWEGVWAIVWQGRRIETLG